MIAHETIEQVKALSIYDVVSKYPDITLKKSGQNWKANSPWNADKTPSFYVVKSKNMYKDFSSGKGGNPINFVMEKEGIEYIDAVKSICQQHGITIQYDKNAPKDEPDNKVEIRHALEWACAHFCANPIPEDFTKFRAFPEEKTQAFKLGYAKPGWDDLLLSSQKANIPESSLLLAGLLGKSEKGKIYDAYRDRIVFPIFDIRGNVIAFTARVLNSDDKKIPKYINSPESTWDKSKNLYGLYQANKGGKLKDGCYLVEGPTDVIRWHMHDLTNTVAPCGSALTEDQAKLIKRFTDKLTIVPDNDCDKEDNPGLKALHRNAQVAIKAGLSVKILIPGVR